MATHDFVLDNGPGLAVRTDMNAALQALASQNSGPTEPTTMYAGMIWLDTSALPDGVLRQRNLSNTAWVTPTVLPAAFGNIVQTVLTSSGNYAKPAGLRYLEVTVVGGGGGSTGCNATIAGNAAAGGGGGGGGTVRKLYAATAIAASTAYTIGAGGAAGGTGGAGGSSTFMGLTADGGTGGGVVVASGTTPAFTASGLGGAASGGDLNLVGGNATSGVRFAHGIATGAQGAGGSSFLAAGQAGLSTSGLANARAGNFPGGGACGPAIGASQAAQFGALGGAGCIILGEIF